MDGDCPQFTDTERMDALVGPHERLQGLQVESPVGVRHVRPGQSIHARVSTEVVALGKFWEAVVKAAREVVADLPDLPIHDVEVVEEPLLGLRDLTFLSNHFDDVPVPSEKHLAVLADSGEEQTASCALVGGGLGRSQAPSMLHEPFDPEYLGADRRWHGGRSRAHNVYSTHFRFRVGSSERPNAINARGPFSAGTRKHPSSAAVFCGDSCDRWHQLRVGSPPDDPSRHRRSSSEQYGTRPSMMRRPNA